LLEKPQLENIIINVSNDNWVLYVNR
jgi:hypothetical protein